MFQTPLHSAAPPTFVPPFGMAVTVLQPVLHDPATDAPPALPQPCDGPPVYAELAGLQPEPAVAQAFAACPPAPVPAAPEAMPATRVLQCEPRAGDPRLRTLGRLVSGMCYSEALAHRPALLQALRQAGMPARQGELDRLIELLPSVAYLLPRRRPAMEPFARPLTSQELEEVRALLQRRLLPAEPRADFQGLLAVARVAPGTCVSQLELCANLAGGPVLMAAGITTLEEQRLLVRCAPGLWQRTIMPITPQQLWSARNRVLHRVLAAVIDAGLYPGAGGPPAPAQGRGVKRSLADVSEG